MRIAKVESGAPQGGLILRQNFPVRFHFDRQVVLGGVALVAMVEKFDGLLETDRDQEADDDGGNVEEEVAPGMWSGVPEDGRRA